MVSIIFQSNNSRNVKLTLRKVPDSRYVQPKLLVWLENENIGSRFSICAAPVLGLHSLTGLY